MEPNKSEESGEMYSPDNQGEYAPEVGAPSFSIQGLLDALTALKTVTEVQPPSEEFANKSEESGEMYSPDNQGEYAPEVGAPSFSIQGLLDALTALETVTEVQPPSEEFALQLGPRMAYLFFFDKQGSQGLTPEAADTMRTRGGGIL